MEEPNNEAEQPSKSSSLPHPSNRVAFRTPIQPQSAHEAFTHTTTSGNSPQAFLGHTTVGNFTDQALPTTPSPGFKENEKPRSLRRVIRADDSWQAARKSPQTAFKVDTAREQPLTPDPPRVEKYKEELRTPQTAFKANKFQDQSLVPAPLKFRTHKEVGFKRSAEFLKSVQPLKTPEWAAAGKPFSQESSTEERDPEPHSFRKRSSPSAENLAQPPRARKSLDTSPTPLPTHDSAKDLKNSRFTSKAVQDSVEHRDHLQSRTEPAQGPEPPRLTRELVLRHLASQESLDSYVSESSSEGPLTEEEVLRRIKKARRVGVILECPESESEDEKVSQSLGEGTTTMADLLHPESAAAMTEHRREAVRLAKAQESTVLEKCKRSNQQIPGYSFDELIGKGSYGRVYKGRHNSSKKVVAIKVIDIDEADFHASFESKDEQIQDFNREIRILKQAQDSGAPNMNLMIEALPVHSQLWLVCEYCPGGSVKTLMRATNDRLSEHYIIVVARELAKALVGLHAAGIMHRDIKAANVLIHEEGRLELCDFGVATVLDTKNDKRKTFIGTPHWMPPELFVENPEYSDEVDVWEYGCTLYECALGKPPHSDLRERHQLASRMRRLKQSITLPEHEEFSDGLRDLVAYTLSPDAKKRPSMRNVLDHEYLLNTEVEYPTASLSQLVKVYYAWLYSGGQRASLFMPGGAVVSDAPGSLTTAVDEWNFSTTEIFEKRISAVLDIPDFSRDISMDDNGGEATPKAPRDAGIASPPLKEMTNVQKANFEARVQRGEVGLANIFDHAQPDYEYKTRTDFRPQAEERRVSDLPFRAMAEDRPSSIASNVIDLGDFDSDDYAIAAPMKEETIQLADAATIRAKRSDSKGPTRSSSTSRDSVLEDDMSATVQENPRISTHDFAFPPKEWISGDKTSNRGVKDPASELAPSKEDSRRTMEWTFASAQPSSADEDDEPQPVMRRPSKAKKHATLEWSFSSAMAEADTGSDEDGPSTSTRTTPKRPTPLLRTMTQPVTSTEVHTAEEFPRPSTAMSEAYSESSMSSADFDPFALDGDSHHQQLPSTLAQAMDDMGVGSYYANPGLDLEHVVPYASATAGPAPTTTTAPFPLGAPARIGEPNFPGPHAGAMPSSLLAGGVRKKKPHQQQRRQQQHQQQQQDSTSSGGSSSGGGSGSGGGRPRIEMPDAVPPSAEALALDAPAEVVENELSRMLAGLQASLGGAGQALGMVRPGGRRRRREKQGGNSENGGGSRAADQGNSGPRGRTRPSSSEWEDEE